jgi:hypothetical protein
VGEKSSLDFAFDESNFLQLKFLNRWLFKFRQKEDWPKIKRAIFNAQVVFIASGTFLISENTKYFSTLCGFFMRISRNKNCFVDYFKSDNEMKVNLKWDICGSLFIGGV